MDLIDRQAAIDALEERLQANGHSNVDLVSELNRSVGYLMRLPSIDAVEVVRCADCKHCQVDNLFDNYWCDGQSVWADHYCSKGERR